MKDSFKIHADYAKKFIGWGTDRYICGAEGQGTVEGQIRKMFEEASETQFAIAGNDKGEIIDGLGDTFVTMVMVSERAGIAPERWMDRLWSGGRESMSLPVTGESDPIGFAGALLHGAAEAMDNYARGNENGVLASLGASYVALGVIARDLGLSLAECMEAAWLEIKDRKGRMIDGKFVKEAA